MRYNSPMRWLAVRALGGTAVVLGLAGLLAAGASTRTERAGLPPPTAGKTFNVAVVSGTVTWRRTRSGPFRPLAAARQFPVGVECDATKGRMRLTSAAAGGRTQTADFSGGRFVVTQTRKAGPVTELTLSGPLLPCTYCRLPAGRGSKQPPRRERHVFGSGKGAFETKGKFASARVNGTTWETQDVPGATVVRVTSGTVDVTNRVTGKHTTVHAHRRLVVRASGKSSS